MTSVCKTVQELDPPAWYPGTPAMWAAHRRRPVKPSGLCTTCEREARVADRRRRRGKRVERTYGLTPAQHDALFRRQGGRCPCGRRITLRSPVDHDHSSGAVRGLMCDPCNRFLGYVKDNPQAFLNLWAYATRPPAQNDLVTDHPFLVFPGLHQCTWGLMSPEPVCGRLEGEHAR